MTATDPSDLQPTGTLSTNVNESTHSTDHEDVSKLFGRVHRCRFLWSRASDERSRVAVPVQRHSVLRAGRQMIITRSPYDYFTAPRPTAPKAMALMSDCLLREALESRFTDESEVRDVASYGCISGVSGFIYYRETIAFFDEHQNDIENWLLNDHDFSLVDFCKNAEDVDQLKNAMVWAAVDLYCQERTIYNETLEPA